MVKIVTEFLTQ